MASSRGSVTARTRTQGTVYQARYRDHGGIEHCRTFKRKADAERWLSQIVAQLQIGDLPDPRKGRTTLRVFTEHWQETLDVKPNTASAYRFILKNHILPTFGDTALRNITTENVRKWNAKLRRSETLNATSVAKCYRLLRQILTVAVEDGYINKNPCIIREAGKEPPYDPQVPLAEEVLAISNAIEPAYRVLVLIAGFGGLRWGEVIALRRKHVDIAESSVRVMEQITEVRGDVMQVADTKTSAGKRTVYLPAFVMDAIVLHLTQIDSGPDALLFPAQRPVGRKSVNQGERYLRRANFRKRVWLPAPEAAGCSGVRFHDLRHCAATLAATTGATLKELMAHIGHSSPVAAMRYQHANQDRQKKIALGINALVATEPAKVRAIRRA